MASPRPPCRSELAREKLAGRRVPQEVRVIVGVLREQARSYRGWRSAGLVRWLRSRCNGSPARPGRGCPAGVAAVLATEQPALLQHRHHQLGEVLQAVRQHRVDDEAIAGAALEPGLDRIGDLLRAPTKSRLGREKRRATFTQAQAFIPGQLLDPVGTTFLAVGAAGRPVPGRVRPAGTG